MTRKYKCPRCTKTLVIKAIVDSDDRIESTWLYCSCGYDQRTCRKEEIHPQYDIGFEAGIAFEKTEQAFRGLRALSEKNNT